MGEGDLPAHIKDPTPPPEPVRPSGGALPPEKEAKVAALIAVGATSREHAVGLLEAAEWNADVAASLL